MKWLAALCAIAAALTAYAGNAAAQRGGGAVPQFRDYPAAARPVPAAVRPDLSDPDAKAFRTRLQAAATASPNFAGTYSVATWGCGTSCVSGAAVDRQTGRVTFFPFSVCCHAGPIDDKFNALEFRRNSRLIVFTGLRNEQGVDGSHFYEFDGKSFRLIKTIAK